MIKYKDTAEAWMTRIDEALEFRKTYGIEARWATLEAMFMNLEKSGAEFGPNIIAEMGDALISRLGVSNPIVGVSPSMRDPRSVQTYPIVNAVDRWLMSELRIPIVIQDVILHAYLWGRGIVKLGYDSEWGYDEAFDLGSMDLPWGMTMTQFNKKGSRLEYAFGRPGMPWVAPVLPHDLVVPWGTIYLEWCPWVAHRVIRHIDLLRQDPKYGKTRDLQPTVSMKDVMDSYLKPGAGGHRRTTSILGPAPSRNSMQSVEFVELWEIRNRINNKIIAVTEKAVHRNDDDTLQLDGFPYKSITFGRHPRSFWTTPQAEYLRYHQAEQFDIALQASKQRRINAQKYLVREGSMDPEELTKALSPNVGIAAFMKRNSRPREDFVPVPQSNNVMLWQEAEAARRNSRESIGFSRNQLGEFDTATRRTATEAGLVAQGSSKRMDKRQGAVSTLYQDVFRFLNQIVFTFWRTPKVIQVAPEQWPQFTGEEIRAEYSYNIDFGQDRPRDPETRRAEAFQMYMAFRDDPLVDPVALRQYLARVFHDIEFGQIFILDPAQARQALQSSKMEQLMMGQAKGGKQTQPQGATR